MLCKSITRKDSLFGAHCGTEESPGYIFSKMTMELPFLSMATVIIKCCMAFFSWNIMSWSRAIWCFNKKAPHTIRQNMDGLREKFGDSLISRNGAHQWPTRSYDLTPLDFFSWGHIKSQVYSSPDSQEKLGANIRLVIAAIKLQMLNRVMENWVDEIRICRKSRGDDILFKT